MGCTVLVAGISARGVSKNYGSRVILADVTFRASPGEVVVMSGRSGSGKSTLLSMLAGFESPSAGRIEVAKAQLDAMDEEARRAHRLHHIGVVFQDFRLIPDLTVVENVRLPMTLARGANSEARARALLEEVGLAELAAAFPESLSGGEEQRVAVARALANGPSVLLADEPTANLDEANAERVMRLLSRVARDGRTVVVASHDPIAIGFASRLFHLEGGRMIPKVGGPTGPRALSLAHADHKTGQSQSRR